MGQSRKKDIDGGLAWLVMAGALLGMLIFASALFMGGVLYTALLDKYKEGVAKTSLVGSLCYGCLCFLAPVAGIVMNKFSCRVSIVSGGILSTTGFALSAYAPSLNWIIITAGVLAGTGFALSSAGLVCVLGLYFQKWRDQMISLAFISLGAAMFISAPLGIYLLETHGLVATFLIIAAIQAQMCVIGVMCKPSVLEKEVHTRRKIVRKENNEDKLSQYLDVTLLKNIPFLCFLLSTSAWNFALCVALMHLPNYISVIGGHDLEINLLMTSFAIANVSGRIIGLLVVSKLKERSLTVDVTVLFLTGIITTIFPYYSNVYGGTYIFSIQLGICCGIPNSIMTPVAVKFVGVSKLSEAYGLSFLFCGFGVSTGPFIAGYIYGTTGSYENSFLVAGVVLLVGGVFCLAAKCIGISEKEEKSLEIKVDKKDDKKAYLNGNNNNEIKEIKSLMNGNHGINVFINGNHAAKTFMNGKQEKTILINGHYVTKTFMNENHERKSLMNGNHETKLFTKRNHETTCLMNGNNESKHFINGNRATKPLMNGNYATKPFMNENHVTESLMNGNNASKPFMAGNHENHVTESLMNGNHEPKLFINGYQETERLMNGNLGTKPFLNGNHKTDFLMNGNHETKHFMNRNNETKSLMNGQH